WRFANLVVALMIGQRIEVDMELRHVGHADHRIFVIVAFDDPAVSDVQLFVKSHVEAKDGATLKLHLHRILVHHTAAVESNVDAVDLQDAGVRNLRMHDRATCGAQERLSAHAPVADGDAARLTRWKRCAPTGLLLQHMQDLLPAFVFPLRVNVDAVVERVPPSRMRHLIDEAFNEEYVGVKARATIRASPDMKVADHLTLDLDIWKKQGQ